MPAVPLNIKRVITLYGMLIKLHKDGSNQVQMVFEARRCHLFARENDVPERNQRS
jgi:hypothetical protein